MEKAVNVAQYIYEEYKKIAQSNIDNMKLQKLLYFAQRESIAVTGVPMFSDNLEGWRYGPVCHEVWSFFAEYGIPGGDSHISDEAKYIINNVIQEYGSLESWKLSEMSHRVAHSKWKLIIVVVNGNVNNFRFLHNKFLLFSR